MPSTRRPLSAAVLKGVRTSIIEAHAAGKAPLQLVLTQRAAGTTQRVRRVKATVSRAEPGPTLVLRVEVLARHVNGTVVETVFASKVYQVFRVAMTTAATDKHKTTTTVLQWPSVKARRQPGKEAEGSEALDAVIKLALAKAKDDAVDFALAKPVTNPCVKTGAVYGQFLAALGDAPLLDAGGTLAKNVLLVYHGTPSVGNAERIMCEGFDPNKRSGQSLGPGEYFADKLETSLGYAAGTGAVVLCAVLNQPMSVSRKNNEYTIVNTPKDRSAAYALPLVALPCTAKTLGTRCGVCTNGDTFKQHAEFADDGGQWQRMGARDSYAVSTSRPGQPVAMNGFAYVYDLTAMTQTNTKTSKVRSIRFVTA
jgi:hypothetical protein